MALSLKSIVKRIEYKYGRLGEAQSRLIEELFMEDDDFTRRNIDDIWQLVNKDLADKKYIPLSERRSSMADIFPSGDEYPDIYRESLSELDMDDLL